MCLPYGMHIFYWTSRGEENSTWPHDEPFLNISQDKPEGHRVTRPLTYAENPAAILLLDHGTIDNNVHVQHPLPFNGEFAAADKLIELMIFLRTRHDVIHSQFSLHFLRLIADSFKRLIFDISGE
jgi:dipeptidyl-peptidase-4